MNRGEVYWLNFDPQLGAETRKIRPAVVLSRQPFNTRRKTVIVVPLSKAHTRTEWPLLIAVHSTGAAVAVIDQLKADDKSRFGACLGRLSDDEMKRISEAVACVSNKIQSSKLDACGKMAELQPGNGSDSFWRISANRNACRLP